MQAQPDGVGIHPANAYEFAYTHPEDVMDYHQWLATTAYILVAFMYPQYSWANDWAYWCDSVGLGTIKGIPAIGGC